MIKIDDNIFIDDTLIRCVEYQQFIDELRAKGKYVQPDHWQFPIFSKGESLKPIVGVRQSDARAFCRWLTDREQGKWHYRLPTLHESKNFPLTQTFSYSIGYWADSENTNNFIWINKPTQKPPDVESLIIRNINKSISRITNNIPEYKNTLKFAEAKGLKVTNISVDNLNDAITYAGDLDQITPKINEIIAKSAQALASVYSLARFYTLSNSSSLVSVLAKSSNFTDIRNLAQSLKSYLDSNQLVSVDSPAQIVPPSAIENPLPKNTVSSQTNIQRKDSVFTFITEKLISAFSLVLARFHAQHLVSEIALICILYLARESGKNRHIFRDKAKDMFIFRNIDADLAIAYANAHDAVAEIDTEIKINKNLDLFENPFLEESLNFPNEYSPNNLFGNAINETTEKSGIENEVSGILGRKIIDNLERENAKLFENHFRTISQNIINIFKKDFVSFLNREQNEKRDIKKHLDALSKLILIIQLVHLVLQAFDREELITRELSSLIVKNHTDAINLIHNMQIDLSQLNLRVDGELQCYESIRIIKERKQSG